MRVDIMSKSIKRSRPLFALIAVFITAYSLWWFSPQQRDKRYQGQIWKAKRLAEKEARKGDQFKAAKDYKKAIFYYKKSLEINPDRDTTFVLAVTYAQTGQRNSALSLFRQLAQDTKDDNGRISKETVANMEKNPLIGTVPINAP